LKISPIFPAPTKPRQGKQFGSLSNQVSNGQASNSCRQHW